MSGWSYWLPALPLPPFLGSVRAICHLTDQLDSSLHLHLLSSGSVSAESPSCSMSPVGSVCDPSQSLPQAGMGTRGCLESSEHPNPRVLARCMGCRSLLTYSEISVTLYIFFFNTESFTLVLVWFHFAPS